MNFANRIALGTITALALIALPAAAQEKAGAAVGADGAVVLPVGNLSDATGLMLGPLLRLEYPVTGNVTVTGRAGYLYGLRKELSVMGSKAKYGVSDIPVWGGVEYYFGEGGQGLYLGGEAGLNFLSFSVDTDGDPAYGGGSSSSSETKLGMTAGAGFRAGDLDFRGGLAIFDLGHAGDSMGVMASVGYSFAHF